MKHTRSRLGRTHRLSSSATAPEDPGIIEALGRLESAGGVGDEEAADEVDGIGRDSLPLVFPEAVPPCIVLELYTPPSSVVVNTQGQESSSGNETCSGVWYLTRRPCGVGS